jgi:peptidylprolyl isomerase
MRFAKAAFLLLACLFAVPASAELIPVAGRPAAPQTTDKENLWLLDLSTGGRVTVWLRPDAAPKTVERIKTLTRQHFYDGLAFHRVIPGFMAQGGDPKGDGSGGSTLPDLKAEFNYLPHVRGAVAAARAQSDDSANSQFYIMFAPNLKLDKKYTVFGRVLEGMDYVDAIPPGEGDNGAVTGPMVKILHAYIAADNPPAYTPPVAAAPVALPPTLPSAPAPKPAKKPAQKPAK